MTVITDTGGYKLVAHAEKIKALPGHIHLRLYTTLQAAKDPSDERTLLRLTLDTKGAEALGQTIYEALHEPN